MIREKTVILTGIFCFSLLYFYFYPLTTGIVDETAYLSMAYTFQNGHAFYDDAGIESAPASVTTSNHLISRYPPGNSILLIPFTKFNWKWSFVRNYILMILGYGAFIIILMHFHLPLYYALLFLFHPSLVLYSRTIMSDIPATVICLIGLLLLIKKKNILSGLFFGAGICIRYPVIVIPVMLGLIYLYKKEHFEFIRLAIGVLLGIVPLFLYNLLCFKSLVQPINENLIGISIKNFVPMLGQFFTSLNILYPMLLILPFKSRLKEKYLFILPAMLFLLFFSLQYYIDSGKNFFETIVRGQRYMLPVIPFLLIPYAEIINRIKPLNRFIIIFLIALAILNTGIHYEHQKFLKQQLTYQNKIYCYLEDADLIICNKDIYELINPFIKILNWVPFEHNGEPLKVKVPENKKQVYLACLTRDEKIKNIFLELLKKFPEKKEIYSENTPDYLSIWALR
ncbi:MAG: hypothetical protein ACUVTF_07245 [bacterium]